MSKGLSVHCGGKFERLVREQPLGLLRPNISNTCFYEFILLIH